MDDVQKVAGRPGHQSRKMSDAIHYISLIWPKWCCSEAEQDLVEV